MDDYNSVCISQSVRWMEEEECIVVTTISQRNYLWLHIVENCTEESSLEHNLSVALLNMESIYFKNTCYSLRIKALYLVPKCSSESMEYFYPGWFIADPVKVQVSPASKVDSVITDNFEIFIFWENSTVPASQWNIIY